MNSILTIWLMSFALVLARVSSFIVTIPYLGGQNIPQIIKAGTALALTCFWFSESMSTSAHIVVAMEDQPWLAFAMAIGREVLIGCAMGYIFGLFIVPFRIAGEYIAQEMGLTLGTITDPTRPETTTVVGEFFETFGALLFFSQNIHHVFLAALHTSFIRFPVGGSILPIPVTSQLRSLSSATELGLTLAAPIACCLFITSLILGLMSRAAPQMNLMSFGYASRIMVGLLATYLLWPDIAPHMNAVLQNFAGHLVTR